MFKNCCGCKNSKTNKEDEVDKERDAYGPKQTQGGADASDEKIKSPVKTSDSLKIVSSLPNVTVTEPDDSPLKSSQDERKPEIVTENRENERKAEMRNEKQTSETMGDAVNDETGTCAVEGKHDEILPADTSEEEEVGRRSRLPSEDELDTATLQAVARGMLATPHPAKRSSGSGVPNLAAMPQWLSQEDDDIVAEGGGTAEPPATPVGRDELALRRHRFFSDLLQAHQAGAEHRVRFDPLGPTVAGGEYLLPKCQAVH
jgi:adenylyl cyclase-associated protein